MSDTLILDSLRRRMRAMHSLYEDATATLTLEQVMTISGPYDVALHRAELDWGEGDSFAPSGQGIGE